MIRWSKLSNAWKKEISILFKRTVMTNDVLFQGILATLNQLEQPSRAILLMGRNSKMSAAQHLVGP